VPHTNAWDETQPLGTALASTIDDIIRTLKADIRERMAIAHVWGVDVATDGNHKSLSLAPSNNTTPILTATANSTTGSATNGLMDLSQTWNTTGVVTALKINITNTASGAGSKLIDYQVGGSSRYSLTLLGQLAVAGGAWGAGVAGSGITVGRNTSGAGAAATLALQNLGGSAYYLWPDTNGIIRRHTSAPVEGSGDTSGLPLVMGPTSAVTDNAVVRWDSTTGAVAQGSVMIVSDAGAVSGVTSLAMGGALSGATTGAFSGKVSLANGDSTTPSIGPSGDTNTGIAFGVSADVVHFVVGGKYGAFLRGVNGAFARNDFEVNGGAFGTGNQTGAMIGAGANTSGNGAASALLLQGRNGNTYYLWVDDTGDLRIHSSMPTEDNSTVADTAGTVVGTQS
jgi:hypothetical protein